MIRKIFKRTAALIMVSAICFALLSDEALIKANAATSSKQPTGYVTGSEVIQIIYANGANYNVKPYVDPWDDTVFDVPDPNVNLNVELSVLYYSMNKTSANITLTGIRSNTTSVSIPDTVYGDDGRTYYVTAIEETELNRNRTVTDISIGNNVETIGNNAFENVYGLQKVTIGNRVREIGKQAFAHNKRLNSVTFGTNVQKIGMQAFTGDESLTSVSFGNMIQYIGPGAFRDNIALTSVKFGDRIQTIARNAFRNDVSLSSVTIPDSMTNIANGAFYGTTHLSKVTIGNRVETIGQKAFAHSGLTSITLPDSVTWIQKNAFRQCTYMTSMTLGRGITTIDEDAFRGCGFLTTANINSSQITGIGYDVFKNINPYAAFTINAPLVPFRMTVRMIRAASAPQTVTFERTEKK